MFLLIVKLTAASVPAGGGSSYGQSEAHTGYFVIIDRDEPASTSWLQ
jgi:hypothetical protein